MNKFLGVGLLGLAAFITGPTVASAGLVSSSEEIAHATESASTDDTTDVADELEENLWLVPGSIENTAWLSTSSHNKTEAFDVVINDLTTTAHKDATDVIVTTINDVVVGRIAAVNMAEDAIADADIMKTAAGTALTKANELVAVASTERFKAVGKSEDIIAAAEILARAADAAKEDALDLYDIADKEMKEATALLTAADVVMTEAGIDIDIINAVNLVRTTAENELTTAENELTTFEEELATAEEELANTDPDNATAITAAQGEVDNAQGEVDDAQDAVGLAEDKVEDAETKVTETGIDIDVIDTASLRTTAENELTAAENELTAAENELTAAEEELTTAENELTTFEEELATAEEELANTDPDNATAITAAQGEVDDAQGEVDDAQDAVGLAEDKVELTKNAVSTAVIATTKANTALTEAKVAYETAVIKADVDLTKAKADYAAATTEAENAETKVAEAVTAAAKASKSYLNDSQAETLIATDSMLFGSNPTTDEDLERAFIIAMTTKTESKKMAEQLTQDVGAAGAAGAVSMSAVRGTISDRQMKNVRTAGRYDGMNKIASFGNETGVSSGGQTKNSGVWIEAFGSDVEMDERDLIAGYDADVSGISFGFDSIGNGTTRLGLAISFADTDVDGKGAGNTKIESDSYQFSLYGTKFMDDFFINGMAGVAFNDNDTSRILNAGGMTDRIITGSFDSVGYNIKIDAGMPIISGSSNVIPTFGMGWSMVSSDKYTETGGLGANQVIDTDDQHVFELTTGVAVNWELGTGGFSLVPEIRVGVSADLANDESEAIVNFTNSNTTFTTTDADVSVLGGTIGGGFSMSSSDGTMDIGINYDAKIKEDFISHNGSLKARYNF